MILQCLVKTGHTPAACFLIEILITFYQSLNITVKFEEKSPTLFILFEFILFKLTNVSKLLLRSYSPSVILFASYVLPESESGSKYLIGYLFHLLSFPGAVYFHPRCHSGGLSVWRNSHPGE